MFTFKVNPVTGNPETTFTGTLKQVSDDVRENVNGTKYRLATIEFVNADGVVKSAGCMIYEKNYSHGMTVGKDYLCTAARTDQGILITVSHLQNAVRATDDDFGFDGVVAETPAEAVAGNN